MKRVFFYEKKIKRNIFLIFVCFFVLFYFHGKRSINKEGEQRECGGHQKEKREALQDQKKQEKRKAPQKVGQGVVDVVDVVVVVVVVIVVVVVVVVVGKVVGGIGNVGKEVVGEGSGREDRGEGVERGHGREGGGKSVEGGTGRTHEKRDKGPGGHWGGGLGGWGKSGEFVAGREGEGEEGGGTLQPMGGLLQILVFLLLSDYNNSYKILRENEERGREKEGEKRELTSKGKENTT